MRTMLMTDSSTSSGNVANPQTGGEGQRAGVSGVGFAASAGPGEGGAAAVPLDFAKALQDYEAKLLRYAATLLGSRTGAGVLASADVAGEDIQPGDLVQEAFMRLHRYCREHGNCSIEHPGAWLYRVVHNLAMDAIRKRVRQRGAQDKIQEAARQRAAAADEADQAALGQLEQREMVALAMRLLGDLPEKQQQVISLKLLEGLTLREIASVLDTSPGSVNYHFNQGLSRLARQLRHKGVV